MEILAGLWIPSLFWHSHPPAHFDLLFPRKPLEPPANQSEPRVATPGSVPPAVPGNLKLSVRPARPSSKKGGRGGEKRRRPVGSSAPAGAGLLLTGRRGSLGRARGAGGVQDGAALARNCRERKGRTNVMTRRRPAGLSRPGHHRPTCLSSTPHSPGDRQTASLLGITSGTSLCLLQRVKVKENRGSLLRQPKPLPFTGCRLASLCLGLHCQRG